MKKFILTFITTICLSFVGFCQNIFDRQSNFIKFLGIPVDGPKYEMMAKLKTKGFIYDDSQDDWIRMTGYFDGYKSNVYIKEYYGKVGRICVFDQNTVSESQIKNRFNNLVNKFDHNPKYERAEDNVDYYISDTEDISYNMSIKDKIYTAQYSLKQKTLDEFKYYINELPDSTINNVIRDVVNIDESIKSAYIECVETTDTTSQKYIDAGWKSIKHAFATILIYNMTYFDNLKQCVWFTICEHYGKYYIAIFYDNGINHPDGSDL